MTKNTVDPIMEYCVSRRRIIFWGSLTPEEGDELMSLFQVRSAWYAAWDLVRASHERYGIPFRGPSAFLPDDVLMRTEELCRKGWNCKFIDEKTEEQVRDKNRPPSKNERIIL